MKYSVLSVFSLIFSFMVNSYDSKAGGGFATVGAGLDCDFNNIQTAVNSFPSEIRIAMSGSPYNSSLVIDQDVILAGGYLTCADAENDIKTDGLKPVISGTTSSDDAITLVTPAFPSVFEFNDIVVSDSANGFSINAEGEVNLNAVEVSNNEFGINQIPVLSNDISINITDSIISSNGIGGVKCDGSATDLELVNSNVINNTLASDNSAIQILNECQLNMSDSTVANNSSRLDGGGMSVIGSSQVKLTNVKFENNTADSDSNGSGEGGALFAAANADITAIATCFVGNSAFNGGAIALRNTNMDADKLPDAKGCHTYSGNTATNRGGAFYIYDISSLKVSQALVKENRADNGVVAVVGLHGYINLTNSLVVENGDSGSGFFNDNDLIEIGIDSPVDIGGTIELNYSTVANNHHQGVVLKSDFQGISTIISSIIYEDGNVYDNVDGFSSSEFECVIVNESNSFPSDNTVTVDDPLFLNVSSGNYHLSSDSPAIDYCHEAVPLQTVSNDSDNDERMIDDLGTVDFLGTFDIGFDEYVHERIFRNSFEACE